VPPVEEHDAKSGVKESWKILKTVFSYEGGYLTAYE